MRNGQLLHRTPLLRSIVLFVCIALAGCAAHRPIDSQYETVSANLEPGDRVEVELRDGRKLSFRVAEIRETELVGETGTDIRRGDMVSVQYADIERLERVDDQPGVYFGGLLAAMIILVAVAFSGGGMGGF